MESNTYYIEPRGSTTDELLREFLLVIEEREKLIWKYLEPGLFSIRFKKGSDFSNESRAGLKKIAYILRDSPMETFKDK